MPLTDLNFYSGFPIDKVVFENKDTPLSFTVGAGANSTQTVANPLGAKCFITLAYSIDGSNYYPGGAILPTAIYAEGVVANGWTDATSVYIYMENNLASPQTFSIIYALDTIL